MLNSSRVFALVIGMFTIYNCFSIALPERRFEIGQVRALGVAQGQIQHLFLDEGLIAGPAGSALGLVLGLAAAGGVVRSLTGLLSGI